MNTPIKAKDILERLVLNNDITDSEYNYLISLVQIDNVSTTKINWIEPEETKMDPYQHMKRKWIF